ncbi:hypothetical protein A3I25_00020 [Candidatus Nomurabacteria bacterium RIFCSPLOWO2_02_FULL_42_17]|uniref:Uncharacterized protein n=1 Tax=Candidatus Nomurabacteria bacterium RIFCSPLOWO2_02_FULL_42_17 TaxID=1801789 RepID=A0A1F6XQM1_9BACT|nr:MAG: hypothetical protein A3I25_00020 [Candidatus Nomurabacteria bacterium RIFCSPLOWO2_02_FULL_42_17]
MNFSLVAVAYADFDAVLRKVNQTILNPLIALLFAVALVMFIWGVVEFTANAGNEEKRTTGRQHILWGIVGMIIMISVFGIMRLITGTIGSDVPIP